MVSKCKLEFNLRLSMRLSRQQFKAPELDAPFANKLTGDGLMAHAASLLHT